MTTMIRHAKPTQRWTILNRPQTLTNVIKNTTMTLPEYIINSGGMPVCRTSSERDAALIAAAPTMLAALEHLALELGDGTNYVKHSKDAIRKIAEAIAEATTLPRVAKCSERNTVRAYNGEIA